MNIQNFQNSITPMSPHSIERTQNRGISSDIIEFLLLYGDKSYDHHGCVIRFFKKKTLIKKLNQNPELLKYLLNNENCYLVQSIVTNNIITTGHRYKRIKQKPNKKLGKDYIMKRYFIARA